METTDYYSPTTVTSTLGYTLGRSVRAVRVVTTETVNPLAAGAVVGVVWGGIAGLINAGKYKQGRITKHDAVLDTGGEAVGLGLASGLGLLAGWMLILRPWAASRGSIWRITIRGPVRSNYFTRGRCPSRSGVTSQQVKWS